MKTLKANYTSFQSQWYLLLHPPCLILPNLCAEFWLFITSNQKICQTDWNDIWFAFRVYTWTLRTHMRWVPEDYETLLRKAIQFPQRIFSWVKLFPSGGRSSWIKTSACIHYPFLPNNEFIRCFHQFDSPIFLSWKRKQIYYWSKIGFFSFLVKKLFITKTWFRKSRLVKLRPLK